MRKFVIVGAALLAATPALAQPDVYIEDEARPALNARDIGRMAGAMERMVGAIMDLPVGGIAAAIDPLGRGGIYPGDTVGDLASRDDPYAEARIRAGIRGTARGVGAMNEALARMLPVLRRSIDEVSRDVEAAMADVEDGEPY
jgi:hypothetical protein